jgi:hypothetical protein
MEDDVNRWKMKNNGENTKRTTKNVELYCLPSRQDKERKKKEKNTEGESFVSIKNASMQET